MNLIANERVKLTASWFNALATALVAAGLFAPVAAVVYGLSTRAPSGLRTMALGVICLLLGGCLHLIGRGVLTRLRE
jgi:uncharacterized membrane protein